MTRSHDVAAAVDEKRLGELVDRVGSFGALPGGGIDRQALTAADLDARRFLVDLARSNGAVAFRDPAGNFFFRWAGRGDAAPVVTGSHCDSQPTAGSLDGAYGVCAAIEVLAALSATGYHAARPIEAVVWTNEEGCRFAPGTMGSNAFVKPELLEEFRRSADGDGVTFGDALRELDGCFADVPMRSLGAPLFAFVEAHIEQGPLLEERDVPIGLVAGIQGCRWFEFKISGQASHAGTTPLSNKHDALMAAVEVAAGVYRLLKAGDERLRLTIGRLLVRPGSPNVVPAEVVFTVDLRHPESALLDQVEGELRSLVRSTAGCSVEIARTMTMPTTTFDPLVVGAVERAARAWNMSHLELHSGAFHDALRLSEHCPTGMVFVPSIGGISHSPQERTELRHLAQGARVLAEAVVDLADS